MAWSKIFTDNLNNGNPYGDDSQPTAQAFNVPFQNTLFLKQEVDTVNADIFPIKQSLLVYNNELSNIITRLTSVEGAVENIPTVGIKKATDVKYVAISKKGLYAVTLRDRASERHSALISIDSLSYGVGAVVYDDHNIYYNGSTRRITCNDDDDTLENVTLVVEYK